MKKNKKPHKGLKIVGITIGGLLAIALVLFVVTTFHAQLFVGIVQNISNKVFGVDSANSFEPISDMVDAELDNGKYLITNIKYSDEYPNSYFDITYNSGEKDSSLPTLVYFHGGGFFGGSKTIQDPMAVTSFSYVLDKMIDEGYNLVNADYALVPDYRFPTPLVQMSQLFDYLQAHQEELHLNMDNIVLMGQSAGAIMVSQYGAVISNSEYAELLGVSQALTPEQVKCVIIDDAPLDYSNFNLNTKYLVGNYVKGSIYLNKDELNRYVPFEHVTPDYPAAFLMGSDEYGHDMSVMKEFLDKNNVENELVRPLLEDGTHTQHCFISLLETDELAQKTYRQMMEFVNEKANPHTD